MNSRVDTARDVNGPSSERGARRPVLDRIDLKILRTLQVDGRISNVALADQVHLSPTAVFDRVKRLTRDGYIVGYEARLNPLKLGMGLIVFIEILLNRTGHDVLLQFNAAIRSMPQVLECYFVGGEFDYLLKTRVDNIKEYRETVANVIWSLPYVRESLTYAAVEEVKNSVALPL
jgi:Lrp/AsnC family leucine-responsive transcriptional regulator